MKKLFACLLTLSPLLLTACEDGTVRDTLGLTRESPDEFTVVSRPPLSLPPEFTLRPPKPGEPPRGVPMDEQAHDLLIGKTPGATAKPTADTLQQPTVDTAVTPVVSSDVLSGGAADLLKKAGGDKADDTIRDKLNTDNATPRDTSNADNLLDRLDDSKQEPTVDAKKEAARLRDNKDANKPLNDGEVPEETPKKRSLIDRMFDW